MDDKDKQMEALMGLVKNMESDNAKLLDIAGAAVKRSEYLLKRIDCYGCFRMRCPFRGGDMK